MNGVDFIGDCNIFNAFSRFLTSFCDKIGSGVNSLLGLGDDNIT